MRSLFIIIAAIITYGSLYPFNFYWPNFEQVAWIDWGVNTSHRTTNGDRLSNLLTFVPLAYFAIMSNPFRIKQPLILGLSTVIFCIAFAYLLQFIQFFIPRRVPTAGDVLFNFWGSCIGALAAVLNLRLLKQRPELKLTWFSQHFIPALILTFGLLFLLFPYFFNFSEKAVLESLTPLWSSPWLVPHLWIIYTAYWFVFLVLAKRFLWFELSQQQFFTILIGIFLLKIPIAHNAIDSTLLISCFSALVLMKLVPRKWNSQLVIGLLVLALLTKNLFPFQSKMMVADFYWMPLGSYLNGSLWINTQVFLEKVFIYGGLLFFTQQLVQQWKMSILLCSSLVFLLEFSQKYFSLGQADITEVLVIAILGFTFKTIERSELKV